MVDTVVTEISTKYPEPNPNPNLMKQVGITAPISNERLHLNSMKRPAPGVHVPEMPEQAVDRLRVVSDAVSFKVRVRVRVRVRFLLQSVSWLS